MSNNCAYSDFCNLFEESCNKFSSKNAIVDLKNAKGYTFAQISANDIKKIRIKKCLPDVLIEDTPEIINQVGDIIPTICIKSYNMEQEKAYCTVGGFNNIFEVLSQIDSIK